MPVADKLQFRYFPIRGKAEPIRLMMEDLLLKYEEIRVGPEWSMEERQTGMENGRYPFGQLPQLLVNDNVNITHAWENSDAIIRYLARTKNMYGQSEHDKIRCDVLATACEDWRMAYSKLVYHPQFEVLRPEYVNEIIPFWLQQMERYILRNSSKNYMVGDSATFVDYVVVELLNVHLNLDYQCMEGFPVLQTYHHRFMDRAGLRKYLTTGKRPERVNGKGAMWDCWTLAERSQLSFPERPNDVPWY